jgi:hypothetical protein
VNSHHRVCFVVANNRFLALRHHDFVPQAPVGNSKKRHVVPPIPFERCADDTKSLLKHEYLTFKLRSVPTAADFPVYELSVPFFNKGSCKLYLITL